MAWMAKLGLLGLIAMLAFGAAEVLWADNAGFALGLLAMFGAPAFTAIFLMSPPGTGAPFTDEELAINAAIDRERARTLLPIVDAVIADVKSAWWVGAPGRTDHLLLRSADGRFLELQGEGLGDRSLALGQLPPRWELEVLRHENVVITTINWESTLMEARAARITPGRLEASPGSRRAQVPVLRAWVRQFHELPLHLRGQLARTVGYR